MMGVGATRMEILGLTLGLWSPQTLGDNLGWEVVSQVNYLWLKTLPPFPHVPTVLFKGCG